MTRSLGLLAVALVLGCHVFSPAQAEVANQVVAVVGEEVITLLDLERIIAPQVAQMRAQHSGPDLEQKIKLLRSKLLEQMIIDRLTRMEAERLGIVVSEDEVDQALERVLEVNRLTKDELIRALAKDGVTLDEYREELKRQIIQVQIVYKEVKPKIIIPESAKRELYESRKEKFRGFVEVELRQILLPPGKTELAAKIKQEIEAGGDFAKLASQYSSGPEAKDGGLLGTFRLAQLSSQVQEAIKGLETGQVSQPVETKRGILIFQVSRKKVQEDQTFEEVEPQLTEELIKKELNKKFMEWIEKVRQRSYVKVMEIKD
ncbi:MAG: SurA N-terminal domain-containing protein [Deltaproteobacteria bacterium]|nr:SurA N-terminal domain-containing protein [Deltaproteobacteria bacterium]